MAEKRRKKKMKAGTVRKIVIAIIVAALVIAFGLRYLQKKVTSEFGSNDEDSVLSAEVTTGSISTTVSGSGILADEDSVELEIPSTVTFGEIYVEEGDTVKKGDLLASVDSASVLSAMSDIQSEIDELDEELADAEEDSADDDVTSSVTGRVKVINVSSGDDVVSVMYDKGSLMMLSLDGYLAVDIDAGSLTAGDSVSVKSGDTTYSGTVDSVLKDTAVVLISDQTATVGKKAKVYSGSKLIGSGKLYIHESLAVTGYAGTVYSVSVSLNQKVYDGSTLITLTDTDYSANYSAILNERNDLEEELQDLVKIYKEGAVYAQCDGTVTEVTDASSDSSSSGSSSSSSGSMSSSAFLGMSSGSSSSGSSSDVSIFAICPDTQMTISIDVDESNILSLENGQTAAVSVDSLSDQTFSGEVTSVERAGTSSDGVTTYAVEITIDKDDSMLSGMSASASISIEGVENALLVPADAVKKTSSTAYVYTSYDEENDELGDMVEVVTGISNSNYIEITEGLTEGQTVYYKESTSEDSMSGFGGFDGGGSFGDFGGGGNGGGSVPSMSSGGGGNMPSGGGDRPSGNGKQ